MATHKTFYVKENLNIKNNLTLFNNSNSISIRAPILEGSFSYTLPENQGYNGSVLTSDGNGYLSFNILNEQNTNTGFEYWNGSGNYWSITAGPTFNLLRGGHGYIKNRPITFLGSQNISININSSNYIYIDSSGDIQSSSITTGIYEDNIVLFEVLHDGINYLVKKENHPVDFQTKISKFFHQNLGCIIQGSGAILEASATARKLKITGNDIVEDHGLQSSIIALDPITIYYYYINSSGYWIQYSYTDTIPNVYSNSGFITTLVNNKFSVFRIYALLDNLNTTNTIYCAVIDTAFYNNEAEATNAINNGNVSAATNELFQLEPCQLGYVIIKNSNGGEIVSIIVEKNTFNSRFVSSGTSGSHITLSDINNGPYSMGSHTGMAQRYISATAAPTNTNDIDSHLQACVWIKENTDDIYINTNNTNNSAVWKLMAKQNEANTFSSIINTGSVRKNITSVGIPITLNDTRHILSLNTSTQSYNINLPPSGLYPGIEYIFIYVLKTSTYTITILPDGTDKIDNNKSSLVLVNQYDKFSLTDLGVGNWYSNI